MPLSSHSQEAEGNHCGGIPKFSLCSLWTYKPELDVQI